MLKYEIVARQRDDPSEIRGGPGGASQLDRPCLVEMSVMYRLTSGTTCLMMKDAMLIENELSLPDVALARAMRKVNCWGISSEDPGWRVHLVKICQGYSSHILKIQMERVSGYHRWTTKSTRVNFSNQS